MQVPMGVACRWTVHRCTGFGCAWHSGQQPKSKVMYSWNKTELNQTVGLLQTRGSFNWIENSIHFLVKKKSKLKKTSVLSEKNPTRVRNIPGLSLKEHKALESKVSGRLCEVEKNLIAQRSDFNDSSTKSGKARNTPHLTCKKEKADKEHERRSSHARNESWKENHRIWRKKGQKKGNGWGAFKKTNERKRKGAQMTKRTINQK